MVIALKLPNEFDPLIALPFVNRKPMKLNPFRFIVATVVTLRDATGRHGGLNKENWNVNLRPACMQRAS